MIKERELSNRRTQISNESINRVVTQEQLSALDNDVKKIHAFVKSNFIAKNKQQSGQDERFLLNSLEDLKTKAIHLQASTNLRAETIEALLDARKQEEWADLWEKVRFVIFRMATGIGLALVLLGTYRVAAPDMLDIHLPMRPPYAGQ